MSVISEQVNALKELAELQNIPYHKRIIKRAADTIESLSAKLQAEDMERSADCGGWISCKVRLPDVEASENVKSGICTDNGERFLITDTDGYVYESTFWLSTQEFEDNAIAWMPKPEPYREP